MEKIHRMRLGFRAESLHSLSSFSENFGLFCFKNAVKFSDKFRIFEFAVEDNTTAMTKVLGSERHKFLHLIV